MAYGDKVLDHYENPRNVGSLDKSDPNVGTGCGSAIASSSLVTEWVKGKSVDEALTIKNTQIAQELALPPVKIHCSVLAEDAIKAAIADWKKKRVQQKPAEQATAEARAE
jgi:nitrogen fixation NifU-like protein